MSERTRKKRSHKTIISVITTSNRNGLNIENILLLEMSGDRRYQQMKANDIKFKERGRERNKADKDKPVAKPDTRLWRLEMKESDKH